MSMSNAEIIQWLASWPMGTQFGIDDGGIELRPVGTLRPEGYLEVGGLPDDDDDDDANNPGCGLQPPMSPETIEAEKALYRLCNVRPAVPPSPPVPPAGPNYELIVDEKPSVSHPHTPGPWGVYYSQADHGATILIADEANVWTVAEVPVDDDIQVDDYPAYDTVVRHPVDIGNAALLASAPSMYLALRAMAAMQAETESSRAALFEICRAMALVELEKVFRMAQDFTAKDRIMEGI